MGTTQCDIGEWFDRGIEQGATHMIVVCDTFDHEDYPVFVQPDENAKDKAEGYRDKNMQRVMEVYNLGIDKAEQLTSRRAFNY